MEEILLPVGVFSIDFSGLTNRHTEIQVATAATH